MIGPQLSSADVNAATAQIVRQLYSAFTNVERFQQYLLATNLQLPPYNMTSADESYIKSAFTDLDQLRTIFTGEQSLAAAKDFRTFARHALGTGLF
jgi:hypothetical protein